MKFVVLLLLLASFARAQPRLLYSKYFKGSVPEYVAIAVERSGAVTYQEAKDDDNPIKLQLPQTDTQTMFDLAQKLDHFQRPVESGLKVANMGTKTFTFEDGAARHSVEFNYSQDPDAQALLDWFERITETEGHWVNLDRTVHFDKLGVNDVLLQLQITWDHKRLVDPEQFLPLLDRVAKNESYLHLARERAAEIADAIRRPAPGENNAPDKTPAERTQQ